MSISATIHIADNDVTANIKPGSMSSFILLRPFPRRFLNINPLQIDCHAHRI